MNCSKELKKNGIFQLISKCASDLNYDTYVVGGFVRDMLLKKNSKDIDIVCVGSGIKLAHNVANKLSLLNNLKNSKSLPAQGLRQAGQISSPKFNREVKVAVFKNFGTARISFNGLELEFVGARKESYQRNSRKPIVENGTLEDDQNRRDFTINALALSLDAKNYGNLHDPFDGLKDLEDKIIRTPLDPDITFSDDPLRMMRAIRFAAQLSFDIEPETFQAISKNKQRTEIVSQERVADELNKIILTTKPSYGFKLLFHCGLLEQLFPELIKLRGVETINNRSHKDNFYHTLQVLDNVAEKSDDLWLRWAALLHDIAKPLTKRFDEKVGWTFHGHDDRGAKMVPHIFRKLKLPLNEKMRFVQKLVRLHLRPIALVKDNISDSAIRRLLFETGDALEALMVLCRADITSKNDLKVKQFLNNFDKVEQKLCEVEKKDKLRNFQPPVRGEHIIEAFDLEPCKLIGDIKIAVREAILDGKINNDFHEAYDYMLKVGKKMGLELKK